MSTFTYTLPSTSNATAGNLLSEAERQEAMGRDIFFDNDLHVGANGDFVLVEGEEAVRQAIYHRLLTRRGEHSLIDSSYGVGVQDFVKKRLRQVDIDDLVTRIKANLIKDPRISAVSAVSVERLDTNDGLKIHLAVVVNGKALRFRPFEFRESTIGA